MDNATDIPPSAHHLTDEGRDRYSLGHSLRVAVDVQLRVARRKLKHAAIVDVRIVELTEKIVRSLLGTFEIRWKTKGVETDETLRRPEW